MVVGSLMLIPAHLIMGITHWNPIPSMVVLGAAFVLVPAAMWPSVPLVVEEKRVGTAFGLMTAIQNLGLGLFPYMNGKLRDVTGTYAATQIMFAALGVVGLVFANPPVAVRSAAWQQTGAGNRSELKRFPTVDLPLEAAPEPSRPASQHRELEERGQDEAVRRAVLALPVRYREPVVLFYFYEMDLAAAARTMGLPEGTMKARLSRARALLRSRFPQLEAQQAPVEYALPNTGKEA